MNRNPADRELHDELSLVYLAVDHLNVSYAHWIHKGRQVTSSVDVVLNVFNKLRGDIRQWRPVSEIRSLFCACGVVPPISEKVLHSLLECIAYPARAAFEVAPMAPRGKWALSGKRRLPPPPGEEILFEHLYIRNTHGVYSFTSHDYEANTASSGPPEHSVKEHPLRLFDEFLDPLAAVRMYLMRARGIPEAEVGHHIQQWIVARFGLQSDQELRFTLAKVCDRVNELFYGHTHPNHQNLATRGATVGTAFLIHEIAGLLTATKAHSKLPGSVDEAMPLAVGIYLFLRLRRLIRFRYQFLADATAKIKRPRRDRAHPGDVVMRAAHNRQCVSMLRRLEYTFLQTAMFGIQTGIQGLNFVLRGGLLPRSEAGRSLVITGPAGCGKTLLALQFLCDIASKGGLAVYYSFEEDYDSITERLVTFNLIRDKSFRIMIGSDGPLEKLRMERDAPAGHPSGTLLFYKIESDTSLPLNAMVSTMADATAYPLRALVIDSLNALSYTNTATADEFRSLLYGVVRTVEEKKFFGLLLSEADDPRLNVLPYIADTLIELSPVSNGQMRRMEIRKSRTQDYHRGPHPYHLAERKGIVVYPSLGSVRDTMRSRVTATLSEHRFIALPQILGQSLGVTKIEEKSSILVSGAPETGALVFAMQLLTEPPTITPPARPEGRSRIQGGVGERVNNILAVTFNTSEVKFNQMLRRHRGLHQQWERIGNEGHTQIRWYSPGGSLTGHQIVAELRQYLLRARRYGQPIERVLFYEVELAEQLLPSLAAERLFWPTVLQLLNTEAVTSVFVVDEVDATTLPSLAAIEAEVDYHFRVTHTRPDDPDGRYANSAASFLPVDDADAHSRNGFVQVCVMPRLAAESVGRSGELHYDGEGLIR